jgi:hypothetical protein
VGGDVPVDSEALLVTDFVNLKIKPAQSFRDAYRGRVCMCVFIGESDHTCMSICVCTVFLKKSFETMKYMEERITLLGSPAFKFIDTILVVKHKKMECEIQFRNGPILDTCELVGIGGVGKENKARLVLHVHSYGAYGESECGILRI